MFKTKHLTLGKHDFSQTQWISAITRRVLLLLLTLAFICVFFASDAVAQGKGYKTIEIPPAFVYDKNLSMNAPANRKVRDSIKKYSRIASDVLKGKLRLSDHQSDVENWFSRYEFARMTQIDLESLRTLPKMRQDFFRNYLDRTAEGDARSHLVRLTLDTMKTIVTENYHPAVRYNAMMVIGRLNTHESIRVGDNQRPHKPMLLALRFMLDELKNPKQIDAVRVAAWLGILRHAKLDGQLGDDYKMSLNARTQMIDAALQEIGATDPPAGRSVEGHVWMQRRAVDVLGALADAGVAGNVVKELDRVIADAKAPMSLRCTAAIALGNIKLSDLVKTDAAQHTRNLAAIALAACENELARLETETIRLQEKQLIRSAIKRAGDGDAPPIQPAGRGSAPGGAGAVDSGRQVGEVPRSGGPRGLPPGAPIGKAVPPGGRAPGPANGAPAGADADPAGQAVTSIAEQDRIERLLIRLKYQVECVNRGLKGPDTRRSRSSSTSAADFTKTARPTFQGVKNWPSGKAETTSSYIQKVIEETDALAQLTDTTDLGLEEIAEEIRKSMKKLKAKAGIEAGAAPTKPAATPSKPAATKPAAPTPPAAPPAPGVPPAPASP